MWEIFNSLSKNHQDILIELYGINLLEYNENASEEAQRKVVYIVTNKFKNKK